MRSTQLHTLIFTALLLFATLTIYGQQAGKTLVKSFNLEGNQLVSLDVEGPVELRTWDNNYLRVHMEISLEDGSEGLLKSLVQAGRYQLRHEIGEQAYKVFAPELAREVKIGGKLLEDRVSYLVFHPKNVVVQVPQKKLEAEGAASSSL